MRIQAEDCSDIEANIASVTNGLTRDSGIFQIPRHAFSMSEIHVVFL